MAITLTFRLSEDGRFRWNGGSPSTSDGTVAVTACADGTDQSGPAALLNSGVVAVPLPIAGRWTCSYAALAAATSAAPLTLSQL